MASASGSRPLMMMLPRSTSGSDIIPCVISLIFDPLWFLIIYTVSPAVPVRRTAGARYGALTPFRLRLSHPRDLARLGQGDRLRCRAVRVGHPKATHVTGGHDRRDRCWSGLEAAARGHHPTSFMIAESFAISAGSRSGETVMKLSSSYSPPPLARMTTCSRLLM